MHIHILSDLHQEFAPYRPAVDGADLVILAGDTHTGLNGIRWARGAFPSTPIIYIAGNHEYYGKNFHSHLAQMRKLAAEHDIHFLENDRWDFGGLTFLGCTLWTDMNLKGNRKDAEAAAAVGLNDYRKIRIEPHYRKLHPRNTGLWHAASRLWLEEQLGGVDLPATIIITHHAPSPRSLDPRDYEDQLSPAYASDLEELIRQYPVRLWVHGHIHRGVDYQIGSTRVLSNPRGYPRSDTGFNPAMVLTI